MHDTDLFTLHIHLSGWFDTGVTSYGLRLVQAHYMPNEPVSKRLDAPKELLDMRGERFLDDRTHQDLTRWSLKAIDHFAGCMILPW